MSSQARLLSWTERKGTTPGKKGPSQAPPPTAQVVPGGQAEDAGKEEVLTAQRGCSGARAVSTGLGSGAPAGPSLRWGAVSPFLVLSGKRAFGHGLLGLQVGRSTSYPFLEVPLCWARQTL